MPRVRYCDFSKENAEEHAMMYCKYNDHGRCTLPEIEIRGVETEWGSSPMCASAEIEYLEEVPPEEERLLRFPLLEKIRRTLGRR